MTSAHKPFERGSVSKSPTQTLDNRLSALQSDILDFLESKAEPSPRADGYIAHLQTTGQIMDGIGRDRGNSTYASVSRALDRLGRRGYIVSYRSEKAIRGNGFRYALAGDGAKSVDRSTFPTRRLSPPPKTKL